MNERELIELTEKNIRQALEDYGQHTPLTDVLDGVSDAFVSQLARDSVKAKSGLRELFRKSPVWNEELQALVINGTRTHNPNYARINMLAREILNPVVKSVPIGRYVDICAVVDFFSKPDKRDEYHIAAINRLAPKAYAPGKKLSRVFKSLCTALGVADETAGSWFQHLYAQFADELSAKQIDFKLFVSINPAHFVTMSNPKKDERGDTLVSCHSFNSTDYDYNCGCTGYARDENTFIVFTAADPSDPETLNNRKTTRQIFAYKPGNGLLLQSRLYNTRGGTSGAQEESKVYRDLIQREISALEEVPNLWKTYPSYGNKSCCVVKGDGFGGYADWEYSSYDGKVSIREDHKDDFEPLTVGTHGLCIECGGLTSSGLYCDDCGGRRVCDCCGERFNEIDLHWAYDCRGNDVRVCGSCLGEHYRRCNRCDEYYPTDSVTLVGGACVCEDCLDRYYTQCEECGGYADNDDVYEAVDANGNEIYVCEECRDDYYPNECDECHRYICEGDETEVLGDYGEDYYCPECAENWCDSCVDCRRLVLSRILRNRRCPECAIEAENETGSDDMTKEEAV